MRDVANRIQRLLFMALAICLVFSYRVFVGKFRFFQYRVFEFAEQGYEELGIKIGLRLPWYSPGKKE